MIYDYGFSWTLISTFLQLNEGLRRLNISWNGLGKEGCIALAKSLPTNDTLVDLDITCNRIDLVGLPFLLHGLVRNTGLEHLNVSLFFVCFERFLVSVLNKQTCFLHNFN